MLWMINKSSTRPIRSRNERASATAIKARRGSCNALVTVSEPKSVSSWCTMMSRIQNHILADGNVLHRALEVKMLFLIAAFFFTLVIALMVGASA